MRRLLAVVLAGASVLVIGVSSAHTLPSATVSVAVSAKQPRPLVRRTLPALPAKAGVYSYSVGVHAIAGWRSVPAELPAFIRQHIPHPEVLAGINPIFDEGAAPITDSTIVVHTLLGPGTDTDTQKGYGAYSIQDNEFFLGSNDQSDADQFTYQVGNGNRSVCVWQIDIPEQNYNSTCASTSLTFTAVEGMAVDGLVIAIGATSGGAGLAVEASDEYGLGVGDRWSNTSGSILGYGNRSEAVFGDKTEESIQLEAGACVNTSGLVNGLFGTSVFCGSDDKLQGATYTGYSPGKPPPQTQETNNLVPVIGQAPAALPTQLWFSGNTTVAEISYVATTSGNCLSGAPPNCQ